MNTIKIDMNEILGRQQTYDKIKLILKDFQENKKDITLKRGLYIYGISGLVMEVLAVMGMLRRA